MRGKRNFITLYAVDIEKTHRKTLNTAFEPYETLSTHYGSCRYSTYGGHGHHVV